MKRFAWLAVLCWAGWQKPLSRPGHGEPGARPVASARAEGGREGLRRVSRKEWRRRVLDTPGPVLVEFRASWCQACPRLDPVVQSLAGSFAVVQVDVDQNPQIADGQNVMSFPTLVIFRAGQEVERFVGVTPEEALRAALVRWSRRE